MKNLTATRLGTLIQGLHNVLETPTLNPLKRGDEFSPLLSPGTVRKIAEVLAVDLAREPFQVINMKTFLKTFIIQYQVDGQLDATEVESCLEMIEQERLRRDAGNDTVEDISNGNCAQLFCAECEKIATRYCTACRDCFCNVCCTRMHSKGNRLKHHVNDIIPCFLCGILPSRLQCSYTFQTFCTTCYNRLHVKTLPIQILDLRAIPINYSLTFNTFSPNHDNLSPEADNSDTTHSPIGEKVSKRILSSDWHPFIDASGITYYFNFKTRECMRRPENESPPMLADEVLRIERSIKRVVFGTGPKTLEFMPSITLNQGS
jgi:hypothetical protein